LASAPRDAYLEVLSFLDLDDDGRREFSVENPAKAHRFPRLAELALRPPAPLAAVLGLVRAGLWTAGIKGVRNRIVRAIARTERPPPVSSALRAALDGHFEDEIRKVRALTGIDLLR